MQGAEPKAYRIVNTLSFSCCCCLFNTTTTPPSIAHNQTSYTDRNVNLLPCQALPYLVLSVCWLNQRTVTKTIEKKNEKLRTKSRPTGILTNSPPHGQGVAKLVRQPVQGFRWTEDDTVTSHHTTHAHTGCIQSGSTVKQLDFATGSL